MTPILGFRLRVFPMLLFRVPKKIIYVLVSFIDTVEGIQESYEVHHYKLDRIDEYIRTKISAETRMYTVLMAH